MNVVKVSDVVGAHQDFSVTVQNGFDQLCSKGRILRRQFQLEMSLYINL